MDIAYYLSELLEQLGEVSVPGLGSFTRVRVDGYYNNDEGRFYPPASRLEFTQQDVDDDVLTQYIGVKKRISLASSKYFTEKYITGLKQEVVSREIPFAELGSLYFADGRIRFRGAQTLPDPEFYGYPTISLHKKNTAPVYSYEEPVTAPEAEQSEEGHIIPVLEPFTEEDHLHEPNPGYNAEVKEGQAEEEQASYEHIVLYDPEKAKTVVEKQNDNFTPQPEIITPREEEENDFFFRKSIYREPVVEEEVVVEEEEVEPRRSYLWLWITLIVLAVAGGGIYGWYYYQQQQAGPVKKVKAAPAAAPKDTTDSTSTTLPTAKDTAAAANSGKIIPVQNAPASTIDSTKKRYEVIGVKTGSLAEANNIVGNYKSIGINAHILGRKDIPGPLYKISLGTYSTYAKAWAARDSLLKTNKVRKDIEVRTINPKK